jgi:hypothetical protein
MSKKQFGGLNALLEGNMASIPEEGIVPDGTIVPKRGRPTTNTREITKTSQEGTKEGETRATFIVTEASLEKLKAIAYWDRLTIKETAQEAIDEYIERYEKKNGVLKPIPKRGK